MPEEIILESLPPQPHLQQYYTNDEEKRRFVRGLFDRGASGYDRAEGIMALGTGRWYRRKALERAGLRQDMTVLDVATGTGLVAREAIKIIGDSHKLIGLDPSPGMLAEAKKSLNIQAMLAYAESIPVDDSSVDFVSMGYALRHLSDLIVVFREFRRVLRPGGRVCILEITRPAGKFKQALLKGYIKGVIPVLSRITFCHKDVAVLWEYYWETIQVCVPPDKVMHALRSAGFEDVKRHVELGIFSEYTARKPA
jgi:demethylmenaquinone methyltransferase/2-methoxy-6-polyprenyl-1,4-benzoquinol methylase